MTYEETIKYLRGRLKEERDLHRGLVDALSLLIPPTLDDDVAVESIIEDYFTAILGGLDATNTRDRVFRRMGENDLIQLRSDLEWTGLDLNRWIAIQEQDGS